MEVPKESTSIDHELTYLEAHELQITQSNKRILNYAYQEPAIVITMIYLSICIIGIAYLTFGLLNFNVNVLPHIELTDFILGAIHYPKTLAIFAGLLLFILVVVKLDYFARKRIFFYRRLLNRYYRKFPTSNPIFMYSSIILMYFLTAAFIQSTNNYENLLDGKLDKFNVQLNTAIKFDHIEISNLKDVQVIANLSKHLWLYQQKNKNIFMIPHESVLMVSPKTSPIGSLVQDKKEQQNETKEG